MLREYGWRKRYVSDAVGRNSRLDELQAAILRVKLRHLDSDNEKRRKIAALYSELLADTNLQLPVIFPEAVHVFHLYVVKTNDRHRLVDFLKTKGIHAGVHYPIPVHLQPAYRGRVRTASSMAVTELLAEQVLSLPIYPELPTTDVHGVAKAVCEQQGCSFQ